MSKHPIRKAREKRKLTLKQVAAEVGVDWISVWRWEQGKRPSKENLAMLAKVLHVPQSRLASERR